MKSTFIIFFQISILLCAIGCAPMKMVTLDPITVTENVSGSDVYHGSYTRTTDILNTKLDLRFNWDSAFVIGTATIHAKPYFYPTSKVELDANGFKINKVNLIKGDEKSNLKYAYNGKKLMINLDREYSSLENFTILVDYVAMPNNLEIGKDIASAGDRGIYFINRKGDEKDKPRQIWTQGETECNSSWFPTINDPQEKMTQEINLTVAENFVTLSNGLLEYSSLNGDGTRTDSWRQEQAHSTYLTMIAVGDFSVTKDEWNDKEISYYTEPAFASTARLVFGKTPEMMDFFSTITGVEYPWEKYSQIVVRDFVSGAMENTTASVFFDQMNMTEGEYQDENHEDIIAHELFHHWFGNLVTAESWSNLPLNESFATYGEYLWEEFKYGRDAADLKGLEDLSIYLEGSKKKQVDVIRFDYADREQMFDEVSYHKGGRILHMLRKTIGDEAFFKSLTRYLKEHAFRTAEIHNLRTIMEEVSGRDLNWFFNQWFLASGHPVLNVEHIYNPSKKEGQIRVMQLQGLDKTPLFTLPVSVDIYAGGEKTRKEFLISKQSQILTYNSETQPDLINFDAEKYLLAEINQKKTLAQLLFQYQHGSLFMDRFEAVKAANAAKSDPVSQQISRLALSDPNWMLRKGALSIVSSYDIAFQEQTYSTIRSMAISDPSSHVRAASIEVLKTVYRNKDNRDVFQRAKEDTSPAVLKAVKAAG